MGILDDKLLDDVFKQQINWRSRESFKHAQEILKPFGQLDAVIKWCKDQTEEDWRWQMVTMANDRDPGRYIFYFDSSRDFLAFTLKWS